MLRIGEPAGAKSPRWRYRLTTMPGNGGSDPGVGQVVLGGVERVLRVLDRLLLDLDQQLDLTDLVVSGLREINALGCLLFGFFGGFERPPGNVDLGAGGEGLCEPSLGEVELRAGGVAGLGDLLLPLLRAGALLLEPGETHVLQFRQGQRGLRSFDAGMALIDALFNIVNGQFQGFLRPSPIREGGGGRPPGDLDLDRHLLAHAVQVGAGALARPAPFRAVIAPH